MKQEMVETFEKINEKRKLPKEIIQKIIKEINDNFLMSIAIMLYFIVLIMGSINAVKGVREIDFKIFSILLLSISIFFFEKGYRKDSGKIALYGVEILVVAIITLFLSYIIFEVNPAQKKYYFMIGAYIAVYYIIKTIFVCITENKKYRKENINSDIKEIVKKEERNRETYKTVKEDYDAKENENEIEIQEKNNDQEKTNKKIDEKPKSKRGRPRKFLDKKLESVIDESKVITTQKAEAKRGRGRPKKSITVSAEKLRPVIDESKIITTQKAEAKRGRGRPRKVVS